MITTRGSEGRNSSRAMARETAEGLFKRKPQIATATKETARTSERRPVVWKIAKKESPKIRPSDEAQIRTWLRYGLTSSQAAAIFQVPLGEIKRIAHRR